MSEHNKNFPVHNIDMELLQAERKQQDDDSKRLLKIKNDYLPPDYIVYDDWAQENKQTRPNETEFLEFIATINPAYLDFFNQLLEQNLSQANPDNKKGMVELQTIYQEYERKLEFLRTNYSLPLTDEEAVQVLIFLNPEQNQTPEIAKNKVEAWRKLAVEWDYPEGEIIYLARGGFNLKEVAPKIKDEHHTIKVKSGGLCDFSDLQHSYFKDANTEDEIRFFIPRLVPESQGQIYNQQSFSVWQIAEIQELQQKTNLTFSVGKANQIANQIIAHYNATQEKIPLDNLWARTNTRNEHGDHLRIGDFDNSGLECCDWYHTDESTPEMGCFVLGVEKIPSTFVVLPDQETLLTRLEKNIGDKNKDLFLPFLALSGKTMTYLEVVGAVKSGMDAVGLSYVYADKIIGYRSLSGAFTPRIPGQ